jgi:hypothetical protein
MAMSKPWDQYDTNVVFRVFSWAMSNGFADSSEGKALGRARFIEVLGKLGVKNPDAMWPEEAEPGERSELPKEPK